MSPRIFIDSENARAALIACLVAEMRKDNRSWCGETHIQEAVYFLQEITEVPLPFKFILHKHGPCCFKLRDELTNLRAEGWLELEMADPYAPRFQRTIKREATPGGVPGFHKFILEAHRFRCRNTGT